MKKYLLIILIFVFAINIKAQDYKAEIKKQFSEYFTCMKKKDFEKSTSYIIPDFFKFVSKEKFIKVINDSQFKLKYDSCRIFYISDTFKIDNSLYVKFHFSNFIEIKLENNDPNSQKESLEIQFGKGMVEYIKKLKVFRINALTKAIAKEIVKGDWKFIITEDYKLNSFLKKFIPEQLLD